MHIALTALYMHSDWQKLRMHLPLTCAADVSSIALDYLRGIYDAYVKTQLPSEGEASQKEARSRRFCASRPLTAPASATGPCWRMEGVPAEAWHCARIPNAVRF